VPCSLFHRLAKVATRARLKIRVHHPRGCLPQIDRYDNHIAVLNFILCGAPSVDRKQYVIPFTPKGRRAIVKEVKGVNRVAFLPVPAPLRRNQWMRMKALMRRSSISWTLAAPRCCSKPRRKKAWNAR
jgi:hypothetical protein